MNGQAIERLNYFNGQRLDAADFKVEQNFHVNVRRWLNKSVFTPGTGAGLEVEKVLPEPAHNVQILPGLALDSLGREMIVVAARVLPVAGKPSEPGAPVTGNYVVIEYQEEAVSVVNDGCSVRLGATCATEDLAWGAPSRILSEPRIYIQHQWPKVSENKVVLAQLELDNDCAVRTIRTYVRKYVGQTKPAQVRARTIEGEKNLDKDNPKTIYFHVEGGVPERASLYLRGLKFSTLFYTEPGVHQHAINFASAAGGALPAHTHTVELNDLAISEAGVHRHEVWADVEDPDDGAIELAGADQNVRLTGPGGVKGGNAQMEVIESGGHTHQITGPPRPTSAGGAQPAHTHSVVGSTGNTGLTIAARNTGGAYTFLNDMRVAFDGLDVTAKVTTQLTDRDGPGVWTKLGDGTSIHKLSAKDANDRVEGTGEIDLLRLDIDLSPGEHRITLSVPSGGGAVHYGLYIE